MSTFDPSMLIPDNDPETIWKELKLGDLLEDSKKSMLDTLFYKRQLESIHQPAIVKHEKMLKKPGFNVLMDRYQSNPTDPIVCPKNKLDKLADPLRGKYSHFDDILSDEQKFDVALKERDQSSSQKSVTKSIRSPLKKAGVSPTRSLGDGVGGFFLTATGVDDDDNDNVYVSKNYDKRSENLANMEDHVLSRVRRRLEEAAKIESYIADPIDGRGRGRENAINKNASSKSRPKALGRGEAAPRPANKKKPVPKNASTKPRPAWEDPLAKKYAKGEEVAKGRNGRGTIPPGRNKISNVPIGPDARARGESEERGFVGRLMARARATDSKPMSNNNNVLKKKAVQSQLARAGRAMQQNDPLARDNKARPKNGRSGAAVDDIVLNNSGDEHGQSLYRQSGAHGMIRIRNKSTVNLHAVIDGGSHIKRRSSSRSAPSLLKGLQRVDEDPVKKILEERSLGKKEARFMAARSSSVTKSHHQQVEVEVGKMKEAKLKPITEERTASVSTGTGASNDATELNVHDNTSQLGVVQDTSTTTGSSCKLIAPALGDGDFGRGCSQDKLLSSATASGGGISGSGVSGTSGSRKINSSQGRVPVVPTRSTNELIESLKRVEESEAGRGSGAEAKLASELLKRATRIGGHLAAAQSFAEKYKQIDIDPVDDAV